MKKTLTKQEGNVVRRYIEKALGKGANLSCAAGKHVGPIERIEYPDSRYIFRCLECGSKSAITKVIHYDDPGAKEINET